MKEYIKFAAIVIGIVVIFISLIFIKKLILKASRRVSIGVWNEGFWNNKTKTLDVEKIKQFEKHIDKKVAIANYFKGWDELDNPSVAKELDSIYENGWIPMVSTNPYHTDKCKPSIKDMYTVIAEGNCDKLIHDIAKVIKSYGKPMFLRFAWEMNIDSNAWSIQSSYSSPKAFIEAWRRVHTIFAEEEVENVKWVFSVNTEKENSTSISSLYPGDMYVDWTGIDGYNWGTTQNWSHWSSFDEIFHNTYKQVVAVAPDKPLMISEFNSVSVGGNKSEWMIEALDVQIPNNYPNIQAIIFFNEDKTSTEGIDWRIETSSSVLDTVKKSLGNRMYTSSVKNWDE